MLLAIEDLNARLPCLFSAMLTSDFENDRIHFTQQKTGDLWEMELFPEVKAALQDYILTARPKIQNCQNVFLTTMIPYKPLDSYAINTAWLWSRKRTQPHIFNIHSDIVTDCVFRAMT